MKQISLFKTTCALFCAAFLFLANSTNPPNGRTGAPNPGGGNEAVCGSCHAGNSLGFDGTLDVNGLPATIQPNTTYPISVDITKTAGNVFRAGFQMLILDDSAEDAGAVSNTDSETVVTASGGRNYIEHGNGAIQYGANSTVSYTFDWTSPNSIVGSNITFYAVTVLGNGSGTSQDYSFTNYPTFPFAANTNPLVISAVNTTDPLCNNGNDGSATVMTTGGNGSNTYAWSNGGNTQTVNNLSAGSYMVTVSAGSESISQSFTINNPLAISTIITNETIIDCNNPTASATISASGGTGNFTFLWDNNQTTQNVTGLSVGIHSVTATDANQCQQVESTTITSNTTPPAVEAGTNTNLGCSTTTVQLDGSGSSVGNNFSYQWQTANGNIVSGSTTLNPTVNVEGTYNLVVTDNINGCTSSDFVFVTSNGALPTAEAGQPAMVNCTNSGTVMLNGNGSSQGGEFSYQWTGPTASNIVAGGNTLTPTVNGGGTYTLTVTDNNNGCVNTDVVQVTADYNAPTVSVLAPGQINCTNQSVILDGNGSSQGGQFSYQWTTSNGIISSGANTPTPTVALVGTYTLTVTDGNNGCVEMQTVAVTENTVLPTADAGQAMAVTCDNPQVSLDGSGSSMGADFSYQWASTDGTIVSGTNTLAPTVSASGTYELTVTDTDNGCQSVSSVFVTGDNVAPVANVEVPGILNCAANDVGLEGFTSTQGSTISYLWTTTNGNITGSTTTFNSSANAVGEYCLTVSNSANGCDTQSCVTITAAASPTISLSTQTDILCNGEMTGAASVSSQGGDGNYTYAWSNNTALDNIQGVESGTYTVTVTDGNQCNDVLTVEITEPTAITLSLSSTDITSAGATDGTATATGGGGTGTLTYLWSNNETTAQINNLSAGNYQVTITDANMCTTTGGVSVSSFDCALTINEITSVNVACNGDATGSATVNATSDAALSYAWSSGGNAATESGLIAGTYTVTVADASNCEAIQTVTISENDALTATNTTTDVSCNGGNDGSAVLNSVGGTAPYTYTWPNGEDGTSLSAGTYTVTVEDAASCETTNTVTVNEPTAITSTVSATVASSTTTNDGTATVNVVGGTAPYTFLWNDAIMQTASVATQLPVGDYCVTVTDSNNCEEVSCVSVTVSGCASLAANTTTTSVSCNGFSDGTATVDAIGGDGNYTYAWSSGGNGTTESGLAAGDYSVTINDTDGCTLVGEVTIMQPSALTVQISAQSNIECAGQTSGAATVQASGGTEGYTYAWSNGGTGETQTGLAAASYTVSATDANLCETVFSFEITAGVDETLPVVVTQNITIELDAAGTVTIDATAIDNGSTDNCDIGALSLSQTTFTCAHLGENEITLFVNDINGNTSSNTAIVTVTDVTAPVIECPMTYEVDCSGEVTYEVSATDNCTDLTYSYVDGTASGSTFPEGTTEVTISVSDAGGNQADCTFSVVVDGLLSATTQTTDVSCNGGNDGTIAVSAAGGTAPYIIDVNNGGFDNLSAGTYPVTITDANDCQITIEAEITEPNAILIEVEQTIDEQNMAGNGAIVVDISGGTEGYTFSWTGPEGFTSAQEDLVNVAAGDYVLTVTDANGCEVTSETITVDRLTSTEEPVWAKDIRLFPNPATDILTVEVPTFFATDLTTELLSITGQVMQTVDTERISNNIRLDVSALPSGLYWLKIQAEDAVVVRKIVVE